MRYLRPRTLVLVAVLALATGAILNGASVGAHGPDLQLPATFLIFSLLFSATALWLGIQVRKYQDLQKRQDVPQMNPLLAARTAVFAQACAYTGAILAGWHVALLVYQLSLLPARALWSPVLVAAVDILAGLIMLAAGLVAEHMCKIPPRDEDEADTGSQPQLSRRDSRGYACDTHG